MTAYSATQPEIVKNIVSNDSQTLVDVVKEASTSFEVMLDVKVLLFTQWLRLLPVLRLFSYAHELFLRNQS